jgi:DNA-binding transcriptional LysR family regulator
MIAVPIGPRHRFAVVGSSGYFKMHKLPVTPHDLKGLPCIRYRFTSGTFYRWEFERGGIEVDIDVEGPLTLNDQDLMLDAARDGTGLAYVFEAQAQDLIAKRKLVRVLADWCPAYPGFFLYYPSRRQLPASLRAFVDFAKASAK